MSVPVRDRTIQHYVDTLASPSPTPGGGSVAGLLGALAASLGYMVIQISTKTDDPAGLADAAPALLFASHAMLELADRDEAAYGGYITATGLPRSTEAEKAERRSAMQSALVVAAQVPLELATTARDLLESLEPVVRYGATHVLSDADVAISIAHTTVKAALVNVRTNVPMIKDEARASRLAHAANDVERTAALQASALARLLEERRSGL